MEGTGDPEDDTGAQRPLMNTYIDPDYEFYSKTAYAQGSYMSPQYQFILDRDKRHLSYFTPAATDVEGHNLPGQEATANHSIPVFINNEKKEPQKRLSKKQVAFFRQQKEEKKRRRQIDWLQK